MVRRLKDSVAALVTVLALAGCGGKPAASLAEIKPTHSAITERVTLHVKDMSKVLNLV
jgi:hypothetical protein